MMFLLDMNLLRSLGFAVFALALTPDSIPLAKVQYLNLNLLLINIRLLIHFPLF